MRIDVVTIFPAFFDVLEVSLIGKARERGLLDVRVSRKVPVAATWLLRREVEGEPGRQAELRRPRRQRLHLNRLRRLQEGR